jgi:hypothetical protein
MAEVAYALSIKQPWATLLLYGLKTIEVRSWPTARRGRVWIHAARISDTHEAAWNLLPVELRKAARLMGGLLGTCEITDCVTYSSQKAFAADRSRHLNGPDWFRPPVLYGFTMANPVPMPFRPYPGWVRFFPVKDQVPRRKQPSGRKRSGPSLFPHAEATE